MVNFCRVIVKVALAILLVFTINAQNVKGRKNITNNTLIASFFKNYVYPYYQFLDNNTNTAEFRTREDTHSNKKRQKTIMNYINDKVSELKPYLQDDSIPADDDKLTLEGDDETTIIEILPKIKNNYEQESKALREKTQSFKTNIARFKKLRHKVKKALKIEKVTNKTSRLVTKTIDEMIAHIITNKCTWSDDSATKTHMLRSNPNPQYITNNWDQLWETLKKEFIKPASQGNGNEGNDTHKMFMMKLQDLMDLMNSDLRSLVDKYKVVCHVSEDEELPSTKNILRNENNEDNNNDLKAVAEKELQGNDFDEKVPCDNFKVCSTELKYFMHDFYKKLNETAVSTFTNYAEMFIRDVSDDVLHEKERIYGLIKKSVHNIVGNITEIFKNQTQKFKLDSVKNQYANMRRLYKYISKITEHSKMALHSILMANLQGTVRLSTLEIIEKDIISNADIDLGNLEREIDNRICPTFEVCNGKIFGKVNRRNMIPSKHNVYVKLQLNFKDNKVEVVKKKVNFRSDDKKITKYKSYRVIWTNKPLKGIVTRTVSRTQPTTPKIKTTTPKIETTTPKIETTPKIATTTTKIATTTTKIETTPKIEKTTSVIKTTTLNVSVVLEEAKDEFINLMRMVTLSELDNWTHANYKYGKRSDARKRNKLSAKHETLKSKSLNSILNDLIGEKEPK